jgi:fatty acid amide hydrolase 2
MADLVSGTAGQRRWRDAARGKGPHTMATMILLATEPIAARTPARRTRKAIAAGRSLADEVAALLGDGLLLHHPFARVAPRHGKTVGRPWVITPAATFNLLGLPVTEVPLGLSPTSGLPLGVQVAAAARGDHRTIAAALELEQRLGGWVPPRAY